MMNITDSEFKKISELVYTRYGINLTDKKKSLVVSRLQKLLRTEGFVNFDSYYQHLLSDKTGKGLTELVNRISTNFTYFWREPDHFEHLKNVVLPELAQKLKAKNDHDIRLWCAAAATGEEPYMLAMVMRDFLGADAYKWKGGLLATDISDRALQVAQKGIYPSKTLNKLPPHYLKKYFKKVSDDEWQVVDEIRNDVTFRKFNLMGPLTFKKKFHIIFCRNVMIYFDVPTKDGLVQRLYDGTEDEGYLYIGHSEALGRNKCPYKYVNPALYRKI
ncbi:MAG: protein-glutamate O-methyltransferase CheR [Deltaproteobacteria bacterium]|nr:protein-glutamate O-methyltransferase CheR [Deltaproteobacteria bacterium]